jgi:hypothetical protein
VSHYSIGRKNNCTKILIDISHNLIIALSELSLTSKHFIRLERLDRDKHPCLFVPFVSQKEKRFCDFALLDLRFNWQICCVNNNNKFLPIVIDRSLI